MKNWRCNACERGFSTNPETRVLCPYCGSLEATEIPYDSKTALNNFFDLLIERVKPTDEERIMAIRSTLRNLCYEVTFKGIEWDKAIDEALEKLGPFFFCTCKESTCRE